MEINTKFNLNDTVYLMHDNKLSRATIKSVDVHIEAVQTETYKVELQATSIIRKASKDELFISMEEAIEYLKQNVNVME